MKKPYILIISIVIAVAGSFLLSRFSSYLLYDGRFSDEGSLKQKMIFGRGKQAVDSKQSSVLTKGSILYITGGALWRSDVDSKNRQKLINSKNIDKALYSPDKKQIAYTIKIPLKTKLKDFEGTLREYKDVRKQLLLANSVGANSLLVKDGVGRWGWIPNTNLLWYETTSWQQVFDWAIFGDSNVWIFDPERKQAKLLIGAKDIENRWATLLDVEWSPGGDKVFYVPSGYNDFSLRVIDRGTKVEKRLLEIPYVGGDRGGPPPIPTFKWGKDGKNIFTAFTPLISDGTGIPKDVSYDSGFVTALRIPIDGSKPVKLIPELPAPLFNDETSPRLAFSDDFTQILYYRYEKEDTASLLPLDWFYGRNPKTNERWNFPLRLALYDVTKQRELIVLNDISDLYLNRNQDGQFFIANNAVYLVVTDNIDGEKLPLIKKINLDSQELYTLSVFPKAQDNQSGLLVRNIKFLPRKEVFYFQYDNRLFRFASNKLSEIISNIDTATDVEYYLD